MVRSCHTILNNREKFCYILERPEINKFIDIGNFFYKIYKKTLLLYNTRFALFMYNKVNQQETKHHTFFLNGKVGSSETVRKITFNFDEYLNSLPQHKKLDTKFLEWFIGFTEGDGSFIVSNNKVYFDITQKLNDIKLLHQIRTELGFGSILERPEKNRNVGVFYVTGKDNFLRIVKIFNGNLVSKYKKEQFCRWLEVFNKQYNENILPIDSNIKPSLDNGWLSGFIDAEGCFIARVKKCKTSKLGSNLFTDFSLAQKEKEILLLIRNLFLNKDTNVRFDKTWSGYVFYLSNKKLLVKLINYLKNFPLKSLKRIDFFRWSHIHSIGLNKLHLTSEGLDKTIKLCESLREPI